MEEKKEKGNFWLTVATFIVNKRKAFLVLFAIACIYCAACMNKVSVNQDITKYLPADSETRIGLTLMDEQFMTYGSARIMVSNIPWPDADALVEKLKDWVDAQYAGGRTTALSNEELEGKIAELSGGALKSKY